MNVRVALAALFMISTYLGARAENSTGTKPDKKSLSDVGEIVFGVNYLAPFSASYDQMKREGIDIHVAMQKDVAQFARLGLNGLRVHYYDREISAPDGTLVENVHLALMDELIALCSSNGIKIVITLISGWPTPCDIGGFASNRTRKELTSVPAVVDAECRFIGELVSHVNPFTGRRYADEPTIVAFELMNEPAYPAGFPDEKVTEVINCLVDAARKTGTRKPLYWNCWTKREKAVASSRIDGVTGSSYPVGLNTGAARKGNRLSQIRRSSIRDVPELRGFSKMIYEFDAADVRGAYMYPAMARQFCAEGICMAFQFHYIATDIASRNLVNRTHHLNMFHTPAKAMSLAIAAEVFRGLQRGLSFEPSHAEMEFSPFRIVPSKNLSEMVTECDYIYTADTQTVPPNPKRLTRIWGCGKSPIFSSNGNGCYFFDKYIHGVWRLQLAPSVMDVADPYTGHRNIKTVILPKPIEMWIGHDDIGQEYSVWDSDGTCIGKASNGTVVLSAGDYVVTKSEIFDENVKRAFSPKFKPNFLVPKPMSASYWNFFDPMQSVNSHVSGARISTVTDGRGAVAIMMRLANLNTSTTFAKISSGCDDRAFAINFPNAPKADAVIVRARASESVTTRMEMVVQDSQGYAWTVIVPLTTEWQDIRIPVRKFRYYPHANRRKPPKNVVFDIRKAIDIQFGIGEWLFPEAADKPHGFIVSGVRIHWTQN